MGALQCPLVRTPGPTMDKDDMTELESLLARLRKNLDRNGEDIPKGI